jgi:hypothetical protein
MSGATRMACRAGRRASSSPSRSRPTRACSAASQRMGTIGPASRASVIVAQARVGDARCSRSSMARAPSTRSPAPTPKCPAPPPAARRARVVDRSGRRPAATPERVAHPVGPGDRSRQRAAGPAVRGPGPVDPHDRLSRRPGRQGAVPGWMAAGLADLAVGPAVDRRRDARQLTPDGARRTPASAGSSPRHGIPSSAVLLAGAPSSARLASGRSPGQGLAARRACRAALDGDSVTGDAPMVGRP